MTKKRITFKEEYKLDFLTWASNKGYLIEDKKSLYESFRLKNLKKGEVLVAHTELNNPKVISVTGRLAQLVTIWQQETLHPGR